MCVWCFVCVCVCVCVRAHVYVCEYSSMCRESTVDTISSAGHQCHIQYGSEVHTLSLGLTVCGTELQRRHILLPES